MTTPLLSVIIPVYNGEEFLEESIASVVAQTYKPIEIIVVDDGSTDRSKDIVRKFRDVKYFYKEHSGLPATHNFGIDVSTGEYIGFHDADDICLPNRFQEQMDILIKNPNVGYCLTRIQNFAQSGKKIRQELLTEELLKPRMGFISSAVIRKDVFNSVGKFDPEYIRANDMEWLTRANDFKVPAVVLPEILIKRRLHENNNSSNIKQEHQYLMQALRSSLERKKESK